MYGAILGDMIGAPYEFTKPPAFADFPLFGEGSRFTDDTVLAVAVAEALLDAEGQSDENTRIILIHRLQKWARRYPDAGFGGKFWRWMNSRYPKPYKSYGNGSAMRAPAAGWLFPTLEETRRAARLSAEVTHNHPEGIRGAEATACAIFLARTGMDKAQMKDWLSQTFGYDLNRSCETIRQGNRNTVSCQDTVPEAIIAFLEGSSFEDVIRRAVLLGGDADTLACIAGSIAEAFYGVPEEPKPECLLRLLDRIKAVLTRFEERLAAASPTT